MPTPTSTRGACPAYALDNRLPISITGTTTGAPNLISGASCGDGGGNAPDATYLLIAPADGRYSIDTEGSSLTTVLSVRAGSCAGAELACRASDSEVQAQVEVDLIAGQTVVIVVDAYGTYSGTYVLTVQGPPPLPTPAPTPGDCCTANATAGCASTVCAECVCAADPFCCNTQWDSVCAQETSGPCASSCSCGITSAETPTTTPLATSTASPTGTPIPSPRPIAILAPLDGSAVDTSSITVSGTVVAADTVVVNDVTAELDGTSFVATVSLVEGVNSITATATTATGSTSETIYIVLDTIPPPAPNMQLIATGLLGGGPGSVIGFASSVEADGLVFVTNSRTGETVTVNADGIGAFATALAAQAGDSLSIVVRDRAGNTGPPATRQVGNVGVSVDDVVSGVGSAGGQITIRGTFLSLSSGTVGVTANGIPGLVEGSQFVTRLPVEPSMTSVTLTVRDFSGVRSAVAIPISPPTSPPAPAIVLRATHPAGLVPLTTGFTYSSPVPIAHLRLDADSDGTSDADETTMDALAFTYTQSGLYLPRLSVTDAAGRSYTTVGIVHVADPAAMDARLQPVWQGVKDALRVGDVADAAQFVHSERRSAYLRAWNQLPVDTFSNVDQIMAQVQLMEVGPGAAQYDMRRDEGGQSFSYPVWFQLDQDGLWRLLRF